MKTLDEWTDEIWGPIGTPRRDRIERNAQRYSRAQRYAWAVTRFWPMYMRVFWTAPVRDQTLRPRNFLDVMSFTYLGDFLFYGYPVTQDYADSWYSRIRLRKKTRRMNAK